MSRQELKKELLAVKWREYLPIGSVSKGIANSDAELEEDESHMKNALTRVAAEPESERRGRALAKRGEEDAGGHDDEGEVPDHVEDQHRSWVAALSAVVVVGSTVCTVREEEAAAGGGDEARERESADGGAAEHGIVSCAGGADVGLVHVRERKRESEVWIKSSFGLEIVWVSEWGW